MSDLPPGVRVIPPEAMPPGVRVIPPSDAAGPEAPVEQPGMVQSLWQGLLHGFTNPRAALRQMGARTGATDETPEQADLAIRQREQEYRGPYAPGPEQPLSPARANPKMAGLGEFIGEAAATLPLAFGASRGGAGTRIGVGAATGGAAGALNPVTSERDYWTEKATQTGLGAAAGGAAGGVGAALSPRVGIDAAEMARRGINLTPGMRTGTQGVERKLQAFPILRGYIEGQVGRTVDDLDRAVVRQALEPIGGVVPRAVPAGHDLIKHMDDAISGAYDHFLPRLAPIDRTTVEAAINNNPELQKLMREMASDDARRLMTKIEHRIYDRFDPQTGAMDGPLFKKVDSDLGQEATKFRNSEIGDGLILANKILHDELTNANQALAPQLKNIDYAWAMSVRLKGAASHRADSGGKFTPQDLLETIKSQDYTKHHADFAKGDALMQEFAELANRVVGRSVRRYEDPSAGSQIAGAIPGAIGSFLYPGLNVAQRYPSLGAAIRSGAPAAGGAAADLTAPRERKPRISTAGP